MSLAWRVLMREFRAVFLHLQQDVFVWVTRVVQRLIVIFSISLSLSHPR